MKQKSKQLLFLGVVFVIILGFGGHFIYPNIFHKVDNDSVKTIYDIDTDIDTDDGDEDVDWSLYEEYYLTSEDNLTITKGGIYYLEGTFTDTIVIHTTDNVKLVLNNVNIKVDDGAVIVAEEVDNLLIYLPEGTTNTIEDGSSYSYEDTDIDGAIFSCDDMIFDGSGSLKIIANYQDGIVSKDDLKIIDGVYVIESLDDGIRGKDSVYIQTGEFEITAGGDGIKSTNDTDTEKGYILIENGSFEIKSDAE